MAASAFLNRVKMTVSGTPGTGTITLGSAVTGCASFAEAGGADATKYTYLIEDGNDFEIGQGTYTSSGTTFSRDTVYLSKISGVAGTAKLTLTSAALISIVVGKEDMPVGGTREKLSASRTYYVRTDGSDSNDGLSNTSGGAFLTIQKAINVVAALDLGINNVTIQIADGTYTGANTVVGPWLGKGDVSVVGNTTTPANVIISTTSANCFGVSNGGRLTVSGMELRTTTSGVCLKAERNGYIKIGSAMRFGSCADTHIYSISGGFIEGFDNYSIVGSPTNWHQYAAGGGRTGIFPSTVTLTGTPAWGSSMLLAESGGFIDYRGMTFSGSATGKRYASQNLGTINSGGGGASFYPGNSAGTGTTPGTSPYGLYL